MEEQEKLEQEEDALEKLNEETKKSIKNLLQQEGIQKENTKVFGELVDITKDLENIKYWKTKEEKIMRYGYGRGMYGDGSYGEDAYGDDDSYGRRSRDSRGRYTESYGRRGVPGSGRGRYRGEDMMDEMYSAYQDYMASNEYGNYGTSESMQKIEIMADSLMDFIHHIKKEAKTPEEKQLIDEKLKEIGRM